MQLSRASPEVRQRRVLYAFDSPEHKYELRAWAARIRRYVSFMESLWRREFRLTHRWAACIVRWIKIWCEDRLRTRDINRSAKKYVPIVYIYFFSFCQFVHFIQYKIIEIGLEIRKKFSSLTKLTWKVRTGNCQCAPLTLNKIAIATATPLGALPTTTTLTWWPSARCSACLVSKNVTVLPATSGAFLPGSVILDARMLFRLDAIAPWFTRSRLASWTPLIYTFRNFALLLKLMEIGNRLGKADSRERNFDRRRVKLTAKV